MICLQKDDPQPLYLQVKEGLRQEVLAGVYSRDTSLPDERVLAKQLGLSRTTVRRAILELTEEGLLGRIRGRGTFVRPRSPSVAHAPTARPLAIGVLTHHDHIARADALFYDRLLASMQSALGADGSIVLRKIVPPFESFVDRLEQDGALSACAGLGLVDEGLLEHLRRTSIPTVLVDCAPTGAKSSVDEVTHEGEAPAFHAVRSLIELGHRDIAALVHGGDDASANSPVPGWLIGPYASERLRGYQRALLASGLDTTGRVFPVLANSTSAYARMRALLSGPRAPTAVFCTTDEIAIGVIHAVKDHGWRVPEHVSVIGFGDAGYFCTPLLSTVRIRIEDMGTAAVALLRARIEMPKAPPRRVSIPTEWMPRATCGVPRA